MTRSSDRKASECHVLDFFFDDENGCALTVLIRGVRFHIIADAKRLRARSGKGQKIEDEYNKLISAVREEVEKEEDPEKFKRRTELDAAEIHQNDSQNTDSYDSGLGSSDIEDDSHSTQEDEDEDEDDDKDSGVDIDEDDHEVKEIGLRNSGVILGERYAPESEKALYNWMLSPFAAVFEDFAPMTDKSKQQTLEEWYHGPVHFFNLEIDDEQLSSSQEDTGPDLEKRMTDLIPRMPLPKYIRNLDIPLFQARDINVIAEGPDPEPYHPTRVEVDGKTYFLKMVDMSQYQPTKREIKLLKEIEQKGLHEKIRVPCIMGLVYEKSKTEIMGFLQTDIDDPTPLTKMLDSDVVEGKRTKWARETERMVKVLHEHDIVWGDAKADNFMVDKHGDVWIIDFGGSYTDGWIDPELMETVEGDDMGIEKVVNALKDPEANTFDPAEEEGDKEVVKDKRQSSKKRSRDDYDADDQNEASAKRRK